MGLTLATQVSLDYVSAEDFIEKARLHVLASPVVAALSVNSPIVNGELCGVLSRRMQYWQKFDPRRCGVLGFALNDNASPMDFVDWAIRLPMIYRDVAGTHVAAPDRSFADLMRDGFGDGTWPTRDDWELHLCQLWPQLRPRHTLELRAADGLPWPDFLAVPAMWVGLTYDPAVRKEASAFLAELTATQLGCSVDDIATKGLAASAGPHQVADLGTSSCAWPGGAWKAGSRPAPTRPASCRSLSRSSRWTRTGRPSPIGASRAGRASSGSRRKLT